MLTRLTVDGYRSLRRFALDIQPGLNILVGPNGSGKTNIISFFKFMSRLTETSLPNAISQMGGVGAFFTKEGESSYRREITIQLIGETDAAMEKNSRLARLREVGLAYVISISITASDDFTNIFFSRQDYKFSLRATSSNASLPASRTPDQILATDNWDFEANVISADIDSSPNSFMTISETLKDVMGGSLGLGRGQQDNSVFNEIVLSRLSSETFFLASSLNFFSTFNGVLRDLKGGDIFNLIPSKIRDAEDISTPFGVRPDGSGLSATLYHMQKGAISAHETDPASLLYKRRRNGRKSRDGQTAFRQVVEQLRLINQSIHDLTIESEPFENSIRVRVTIDSDGKQAQLPLNLMSDGTLKWLALTTALVTSGSIFAIEEPENFLHPLMQREILDIIRTKKSDTLHNAFVIMSTHSETLLNAAKPHECIIVSMVNGVTVIRRPSFPLELESLVAETGFGLGHMYVSGTLNYA